jgi:recombination protein RecA
MGAYAQVKGVVVASALLEVPLEPLFRGWSLEALAGRYVELSGGMATAALTVCAGLVLQAQRRGAFAAWIGGYNSSFYPPDFAEAGIDLKALPVVRVVEPAEGWRAADTLLRSGAFAIVVIDLGCKARLPLAAQTRLVGLAKKHNTALLVITRQARHGRHGGRGVPNGSLASLRGETDKRRVEHDCFACEVRVVKDKRRPPGWGHEEMCRGPDGLC